ncbi:hypothetical protein M6B38_207060 [Iris pallida]|uniref:Uncharacterized protein n=1 Tax=Iris pallida TaxID=29817 RepID=A0AAX6E641_IRIPA|nr:hypothetical protein M6B38_207060 [Iris pallida]
MAATPARRRRRLTTAPAFEPDLLATENFLGERRQRLTLVSLATNRDPDRKRSADLLLRRSLTRRSATYEHLHDEPRRWQLQREGFFQRFLPRRELASQGSRASTLSDDDDGYADHPGRDFPLHRSTTILPSWRRSAVQFLTATKDRHLR